MGPETCPCPTAPGRGRPRRRSTKPTTHQGPATGPRGVRSERGGRRRADLGSCRSIRRARTWSTTAVEPRTIRGHGMTRTPRPASPASRAAPPGGNRRDLRGALHQATPPKRRAAPASPRHRGRHVPSGAPSGSGRWSRVAVQSMAETVTVRPAPAAAAHRQGGVGGPLPLTAREPVIYVQPVQWSSSRTTSASRRHPKDRPGRPTARPSVSRGRPGQPLRSCARTSTGLRTTRAKRCPVPPLADRPVPLSRATLFGRLRNGQDVVVAALAASLDAVSAGDGGFRGGVLGGAGLLDAEASEPHAVAIDRTPGGYAAPSFGSYPASPRSSPSRSRSPSGVWAP